MKNKTYDERVKMVTDKMARLTELVLNGSGSDKELYALLVDIQKDELELITIIDGLEDNKIKREINIPSFVMKRGA